MFTFVHALILGLVEGITEFLPISSTGHLILTSTVLKIPDSDFLKTFEIAIQLGAILAVVALYWKKILLDRAVFQRVLVAFLPTAILGLIFYKLVKRYLLGNVEVVLWSLAVGGIALIVFELLYKEKETAIGEIEGLSYRQAAVIGLFQSLAFIPGVSRAAATIIGGLLIGLKRQTIVEFSFLLAIPTMAAATGLDLLKNAGSFSSEQFGLLGVGFAVSFVTALIAIQWLLRFIKNHSFISFGIYRIGVAALFLLLSATGSLSVSGNTAQSNQVSFQGTWQMVTSSDYVFNLDLSQDGDRLSGHHCAVTSGARRIDCYTKEIREKENPSIQGIVVEMKGNVRFNSSFSPNSWGEATITYIDNDTIKWEVTKNSDEHYLPFETILKRKQ